MAVNDITEETVKLIYHFENSIKKKKDEIQFLMYDVAEDRRRDHETHFFAIIQFVVFLFLCQM